MPKYVLLDSGRIVERAELLQGPRSASRPGVSPVYTERDGLPRERPTRISRREFLARGGRGIAALFASSALAGFSARGRAAGDLWTAAGMPLEVTPAETFYTVSKNLFDPHVDVKSWRLEVDGLVHRPLQIDYEKLTGGGPTVRSYVTLTCISNEIGGDLAGNALWRGVPLRRILENAGVKEGAVDLVMEAYDGYTDSIPIAKAMHPDTLLVWEMNGEKLTPEHGYPARLIVPGIYGMKNVKWIRRLSVVDEDYKGYWARRGWSDVAAIRTWSRIDAPRMTRVDRGKEIVIGGPAFAGDRGIERVEISLDGGSTWRNAQLKEGLGPYAWRLWAVRWTPGKGAGIEVVVRAVDGAGRVQDATVRRPLPDGATGYHLRRLNIVG